MKPITIRLSSAAVSALECRGLEDPGDVDDLIVATAWHGNTLKFFEGERDALFSALVSMANAEDGFHQEPNHDPELRKFAGRAARSLTALSGRVLSAS